MEKEADDEVSPQDKIDTILRNIYKESPKNRNSTSRSCFECGTRRTSTWRRNLEGRYVCNRCGIRLKRSINEKRNIVYVYYPYINIIPYSYVSNFMSYNTNVLPTHDGKINKTIDIDNLKYTIYEEDNILS